MRKAKNGLYQIIEFVLQNEQDIRRAVYEARNDYVPRGNSRKSTVSDSTGNKAIALCTPVKQISISGKTVFAPEKWLRFCEILYGNITGVQGRLMVSRYRKKESYVSFCAKEETIERSKYLRLLNDIRNYAVMLAIELGLVSIFEKKK